MRNNIVRHMNSVNKNAVHPDRKKEEKLLRTPSNILVKEHRNLKESLRD